MPIEEGNLMLKLKEPVPVYEKVKEAILLAEYEGDLKLPLTSINELRNCLDHLIRTLGPEDFINFEHEFIEAKAHLYRAGNDSYEILVMQKLESFNKYQNSFDKEAVKEIYPDYFSVLLPLIDKTKKELAKVRSKKPILREEENTFLIYENIVTQLIQQTEKFQIASVGIIDYERAIKKKKIMGRIVDWTLGGLITGIIIVYIEHYIMKK